MNFVQLAARLALECGVSGTLTTTANQVGSLARIVNWVNAAWSDVQAEHPDWGWMRSSNLLGAGVQFNTVAGRATYPLGVGLGTCGITSAQLGAWDRETFRCYVSDYLPLLNEYGQPLLNENGAPLLGATGTGGTSTETFLDEIPFDVWRDAYMYGAMRQVQTRPVAVAFGPDESICLGPPSNGLYTITGDYFIAPSVMVNDTDVPALLPAKYHDIIIWRGMMMYAGYESAPEVYQRGAQEYAQDIAELEALKIPRISFAGALA